MVLAGGFVKGPFRALFAVSTVVVLTGCPAATTTGLTRPDSTSYLSSSAGGSVPNAFSGGQLPDFGGAAGEYLEPQNSCGVENERVSTGVSQGLNIAAFEQRIYSLPSQGAGFCARGVRKSLNALFGKGPGAGPPARSYNEKFLRNWRTKDHCYQKLSSSDNSIRGNRDFDIRVLQPGFGGSIFGHIEIFYKGRWFSDFQQSRSLYGRSYNSFGTYRLSRCAQSASLEGRQRGLGSTFARVFSSVVDLFLPHANASELTESSTTAAKEIRSVSVGTGKSTWRLVDRTQNQGTIYVLQSGVGRARRDVDTDTNSAFDLLEKNKKRLGQAASKLAEAYVRDWIKAEGRAAVQRVVTDQKEMTVLEREAYLKNGLKLAE